MMISITRRFGGELEPQISRGVTAAMIDHIRAYGPITSLDAWAHEWGLCPKWVRLCAHRAEENGLIKLTRQQERGRPYKVECSKEKHENKNDRNQYPDMRRDSCGCHPGGGS